MVSFFYSCRLSDFMFLKEYLDNIPPSEDEITYWWEIREAEFYARRDGRFALYSS